MVDCFVSGWENPLTHLALPGPTIFFYTISFVFNPPSNLGHLAKYFWSLARRRILFCQIHFWLNLRTPWTAKNSNYNCWNKLHKTKVVQEKSLFFLRNLDCHNLKFWISWLVISGPVEKERVPGPALCQAEVAHKRDLDVVQLHMRVQLTGHKLNIAGQSGEDAS